MIRWRLGALSISLTSINFTVGRDFDHDLM
jgi:hypothetical protein